jgi:hypothetical protein
MKVTGHELRNTLKVLEQDRKALEGKFNAGLTYFEDEEKPDLEAISLAIRFIDRNIVDVQEAQAEYNLRVKVEYLGKEVSLTFLIKIKGSEVRTVARWKTAMEVEDSSTNRLYGLSMARDMDSKYPVPSMEYDAAVAQHRAAYIRMVSVQQSIANANAQVVEIKGLQSLPIG